MEDYSPSRHGTFTTGLPHIGFDRRRHNAVCGRSRDCEGLKLRSSMRLRDHEPSVITMTWYVLPAESESPRETSSNPLLGRSVGLMLLSWREQVAWG